MKRQSIITTIIAPFTVLDVSAITLLFLSAMPVYGEEPAIAFLKVQYEHSAMLGIDSEKPHQKIDKFILQIGKNHSYYYDPQTYYVDSLRNDPTGSAIYEDTFARLLHESVENKTGDAFQKMKDLGLSAESRYRAIKNFPDSVIIVYDWISPDFYEYKVEMADLKWALQDSTTTVLDYECTLATADYHGRRWKAWFTPEIPVQDGPWQLCGLPGLILKAETEDGTYGFTATGLQQCNEPFKPTYINQDKLFKSKRKTYLKQKDYGRRNRGAMISAMTNGKVNPKNADYKGNDDFIETDYHE